MTDTSAPAPAAAPAAPAYPYSPGLEGVPAAETALGYVDGAAGRLTYRGYRIGDLVERGSYPAVANLLWTGDWEPTHHLPTTPVPAEVMTRAAKVEALSPCSAPTTKYASRARAVPGSGRSPVS